MSRTGLACVAMLVLIMGWAVTPIAQTNAGQIGGIVRDESGGVLPGATVNATHPATGFAAERVSDGSGRFFISSLPVGDWEIVVTLPGFSRVQRGVQLAIGQTLDLQFELSLGQVTEEITVLAEAPLLQTTNAEISDVIDSRTVEQIPLNGRQFLQLAQLSDAVVLPPSGTRGAALQQAGPLPNVGGSAPATTSTYWTASR